MDLICSSIRLAFSFDVAERRMANETMEPMFLKDVEDHQGDDNYTRAIQMMKNAGSEYPQILHMFSYKLNHCPF
jgi:hypothetical protein